MIDQTTSYDLVYGWFDYLKKQNHRIAGFVIMPNHLHALIDFSATAKKINTIIGDGKRFMAYEIIKRLQQAGRTRCADSVGKGSGDQKKGKRKVA